MTVRPTDEPVLRRCKAALDALYGDEIDRVVLFGSRARGAMRMRNPTTMWRSS
jgi:predicted nucleotidyltransferase